jgi:multidrug efflux pump subunit AcrA (membrane-fusion protein)
MKRVCTILVIAAALGAVLFLYFRRPDPPETPAVVVRRGDVVQTLTTNGKVEALDAYDVRAGSSVRVVRVNVQEGDEVRRNQVLAEVDNARSRESVDRARAQLEAARADQAVIERGGTPAQISDLDADIARARLEREMADREIASLQRLVERGASPKSDLQDQRHKLVKAEADIAALERRRAALVAPEERQRVQSRIREAEIAVKQAESAVAQTEIRSPSDGTLFHLDLRPGGFYEAGALVARVGRLDRVRVRLLVDEPELGPVQVAQPVRITWDALPAEEWRGHVERLPSEVEAVGTRTVGEVLCTIDTPRQRLLPNVTVNVEIRTGNARGALTVPREAVLRQGEETLVLRVDPDGVISRQPVKLGVHDMGRVQVLEGLSENQVVLLPGERQLSPGQKVRPRITA